MFWIGYGPNSPSVASLFLTISDLPALLASRNWFTKLAAICALPVLTAVQRKLDPRRYNGASLLGLNGIVVKSHGGADTSSFLNAIKIAYIEIENCVPQQISSALESYFSQSEEAVT